MARNRLTLILGLVSVFLVVYWEVGWHYFESAEHSRQGISEEILKHVVHPTQPAMTQGSEAEQTPTFTTREASPSKFPTNPEALPKSNVGVSKTRYGRPSPLLIDSDSGYSMSPDVPDVGYTLKCSHNDGGKQVPNPDEGGAMAPEYKPIVIHLKVPWL